MIYFLYNKYKNKFFYIYDLNEFETYIGNIENNKTAYNGFIKVADYGFMQGRQSEVTYESNAGAEGAQASNFNGINNNYAFDIVAINNGNNFALADSVHKLYANQTLFLGAINPETNKGFITTVVPANDIDLANGFLSYISQSDNLLFNVEFGESIKDVTFISTVYEEALASSSATLDVNSEEFSACIVKYPNNAAESFKITNNTNLNTFEVLAGETNINVNVYDRTATSDAGNMFTNDTFAGGFIYLDQGNNEISLDAETYGDTLTIEVLSTSTIRKNNYV